MKKVILIVSGKSKEEFYLKEEKNYLKKIKNIDLDIIELKPQISKEKNDQQVIDKINSVSNKVKPTTILLDEKGSLLNSTEFSNWLYSKLESNSSIPLILVVGAAEGHGAAIKKFAHGSISLSKMTLPHRLARLMLIEQIYRAETIHLRHPYHK